MLKAKAGLLNFLVIALALFSNIKLYRFELSIVIGKAELPVSS